MISVIKNKYDIIMFDGTLPLSNQRRGNLQTSSFSTKYPLKAKSAQTVIYTVVPIIIINISGIKRSNLMRPSAFDRGEIKITNPRNLICGKYVNHFFMGALFGTLYRTIQIASKKRVFIKIPRRQYPIKHPAKRRYKAVLCVYSMSCNICVISFDL